MDASPLAQLNSRQPQLVVSPIDDVPPPWEPLQQRQSTRPNPLQRGPFSRSYTSFASFSSNSSNSTYTNAASASYSGAKSFDMKNRSKCDLFSPMASLSADMSANLNLDPSASPKLPTPRRSLLPSLSFGSQFVGRQTLRPTTPDGHTSTSIDTNSSPNSPLPHKVPSSLSLTHSAVALQNITNRANCLPRPPLNRFKASTFCALSGKAEYSGITQTSSNMGTPAFKKSSLYQFQLANGQASDAMQVDDKENMNSTEATLDQIFAVASPPPSVSMNKNPTFRGLHTSSHSMDASPQSSGSEMDSPLCMNRFTSRFRPKPKVRRTLSMFQKPGELLDSEMEDTNNYTPLQLPCQKTDECQILPCFGVRDDMLKRIDHKTLLGVLDGHYAHLYDEHLIVDCRFPYEFEGGHISGAINVNTWDALESFFLDEPKQAKVVVIFHCEYSAHRAPRLALHLRNRDRHLNMHQYPKLHYPEIYILQGGYSGFFASYKERCEPQSYVAMQDERHKATCAREMRNFGKSAKLTRTQSYTYGITAAGSNGAMASVETMEQQDDDETMNTEDDTFEGIESRISTGTNAGVRRAPSTVRPFIAGRRAVSY